MTERADILEMLSCLQLAGMRTAYDEIVSVGIKRQHGIERIIGALLKAEIAAKQARSINYQMALAKLPLVKELTDLAFADTPINGELITQLSQGAFLDIQRNVVLIGGTGTGKSHIAIVRGASGATGIARSIIKAGRKARFFNAVMPKACLWHGSSTSSRPRSSSAARAALPTGSPASTCWCSTNWAICPSHNRAASFCST